ncbi:hypothetical protein DFQ11_1303 [Winogradskyella epiphytica]|uniref:Uncharacterized protein n=1 Tax=Winogradskyella epiphytica TaxID=262005 RepID=A0A2V4XVX3_9FLAO|nr:hypothetical protein [Winogradskyella epiphytica]PYE78488.1 hypothetical protein DFQ11_1303 [Winogradskyella epiphytica]GGW75728.1 hypothetical protein GCM10008085_29330 [Winogradskyella epiphytica]
MIINPNMFTEKQNYLMYELYKTMENELEEKQDLSEADELKLAQTKTNITAIEQYANAKRAGGIRWSLTSLFQDSGMNPTLILGFYPGSDSYNTYGKELVVNVEYSEADLIHIFESIRDNSPRVTGQLKFKIVPEFIDGELNTGDIYAIQ